MRLLAMPKARRPMTSHWETIMYLRNWPSSSRYTSLSSAYTPTSPKQTAPADEYLTLCKSIKYQSQPSREIDASQAKTLCTPAAQSSVVQMLSTQRPYTAT